MIIKYWYLQDMIIPFDDYFEIGQLSQHKTKIFMSGFYNAIHIGQIKTLTERREGINTLRFLQKYLTNQFQLQQRCW